MKFKSYLREYFSYTSSEKRGILVLIIILLVAYIVPRIASRHESKTSIFDLEEQKRIDSLIYSISTKKLEKKINKKSHRTFYFDPNTVSRKELRILGFSDYQSSNLIKYREKGGVFKEKKDILKIYGINSEDIDRLDTCIIITHTLESLEEKEKIVNKKKQLFPFDPNTISAEEWQMLGVEKEISDRIKRYLAAGARFKEPKDLYDIYGFPKSKIKRLLPYVEIKSQFDGLEEEPILVFINCSDTSDFKILQGIGSVLAARIVKYRKRLGGFYSKNQIREVYGISKEKFDKLSACLVLDSIDVRKVNINSCNAEELNKHPYIDFRLAKSIVRYRIKNGKYISINQLADKKIVPDTLMQKLIPYLKLE